MKKSKIKKPTIIDPKFFMKLCEKETEGYNRGYEDGVHEFIKLLIIARDKAKELNITVDEAINKLIGKEF